MGLGDVVNEFRGLSHAAHHAAQVNRDAYKARQYASSAAHNYGDHKEWHKAKEDINANSGNIDAFANQADYLKILPKCPNWSEAGL